MKNLFYLLATFIFLTGCGQETSTSQQEQEYRFQFNGISLGDSYNKIVGLYGKPESEDEKGDIKLIAYRSKKGLSNTITLQKDKVIKSTSYMEYLEEEKLPRTKEDVFKTYGTEYKMKLKDCYESTKCENYVYTFENEILEFLTYWDNQKIDVVTLKTKEFDTAQ
ncbi:hypothetical protein EEL31_07950 [Brevibacillus laterosporus]|uniref:Lipoprotein n=1 Tax=Brevibacillus laterosporus TaxID=1465 RepID=A0A518VC58_BRELA|nr:hypothetical protein [Brevibacillus laterosporus]QDX94572.1 hypothetical protein EEL30_21200 [Brevibacillus laterosporus]RAP30856.1 hypothetical protein C2W64_00023 [Brevibacillus laterosporus]TPG68459.1 hypothetical protein EEL31_07950 [Brevibacillus laterosporus]